MKVILAKAVPAVMDRRLVELCLIVSDTATRGCWLI